MSERKIISCEEEFRRLLWFLIGGSRGGENRVKILVAIRKRPRNLNQLAKSIGVDYRSVQHHMAILQKNNLVQSSGERYGVMYSLHPWLELHFETFRQVCTEIGFSIAACGGTDIQLELQNLESKVSLPRVMPRIARAGDAPHQY